MKEVITFKDQLDQLADNFIHHTGLVSCAIGVDNVNAQQDLDAAADVFLALIKMAQRVYDEALDPRTVRALDGSDPDECPFNDDNELALGAAHPFNEQLAGVA